MTISSTKPVVNKPTPEQVKAVEEAIKKLALDPDALHLARMQYMLTLAEHDERIKQSLRDAIESVAKVAKELGFETF